MESIQQITSNEETKETSVVDINELLVMDIETQQGYIDTIDMR